MKINIKAHFDEEKKKHEELVAKAKSEKQKLLKDIALKEEAKAQLLKEKRKKEGLLRDSEAEGLDVTKLKDKVRGLELQIAQTDKSVEASKTAEAQATGVEQRSFEREDLMTSVLKEAYRCEEAIVVERFDDVFALLPKKVAELDDAGRPAEIEVVLDADETVEVPIKPSEKHFWRNFRPKALRWLPVEREPEEAVQQDNNGGNQPRIRAYYDKSACRFILSDTSLNWSVRRETGRRVRSQWSNEYVDETETKQFEGDFSDLAISLSAKVEQFLEAEGSELSLEKAYKDNPFLAHLQSQVVAQTVSSPQFKECKERLTSDENFQRIKSDWDAFKNCPWSAEISGTLALLKYHVENGEKARFWSGSFEGLFGFRLRTRDHDWIVGELFISPAERQETEKSSLQIHEKEGSDHELVARLGRLLLRVWRDRSERERR